LDNIIDNTFDFSLPDISGEMFNLSDFKGKTAILMVFFKTGCPTCNYTLPHLNRLYSRYGDNGVKFIAISQDNREKTSEYLKTNDINLTVLIDDSPYTVSRKIDFKVVPTILLYGQEGNLIQRFMGFQKEELEKLNYILAGLSKSTKPLFEPEDDIVSVKPG